MSAWYVFSALGFYPVCPGEANYVIGSPLFNSATLALPNGKKFVVTAANNGSQEYYIRSAMLNGETYDKTFLKHRDIVAGGEVSFQMSSQPNNKWGTAPESRPGSALGEMMGGKGK
jgi:putative alpha-1,2-mannosidase